MPALANPCCCRCLIFSDNFNRANETWPASPAFDSTGKWTGARSFTDHNPWRISSNQLAITTTTEAVNAILPLASHKENINVTAASVAVKSKIPTGGASHVAVTIRTNLVTGDSRVWTAYVKLIPSDDPCGVMQLWDNNIGGASQLGPDIPVPGLDFGTKHNVRICLDAELNLVSCEVDGNWHRGTMSSADDAGDPLHQVVGSLWVDETISGTYYFDDFKLVELKQQIGYGYYYGYGYGDEPHCPICRNNASTDGLGCEDTVIEFGTPDCRFTEDEGGGCFGGSWSGVDGDGSPDNTTRGEFQFHIPAGGGTASVSIGANTLTLTVDVDGNWTLDLSTGESTSGGPGLLDLDLSLTLCCLDGLLIGSMSGEDFAQALHHIGIQTCEGEVCGHGPGAIRLIISHNLHKNACFKCFPVPPDTPCGDCAVPQTKTVTIIPGGAATPAAGCQNTCRPGSWSLDKIPDSCQWWLDVPRGGWPALSPYTYCSSPSGIVTALDGGRSNPISPWFFAETDWMCSGDAPASWANGDPIPQWPTTPLLALLADCSFAPLAPGGGVLLSRIYFCPINLTYTVPGFANLFCELYQLFLLVGPGGGLSIQLSAGSLQYFEAFGDPIPPGGDPCLGYFIDLPNSAGVGQSGNITDPCDLQTGRLVVT